MLTAVQFEAECARRSGGYEGLRLYKYRDTKGIVTLGRGINLEAANRRDLFVSCGAVWDRVLNGPVAKTSDPVDAVDPVISEAVADCTFAKLYAPSLNDARAWLPAGYYDRLDQPRQFVIRDMGWNMGFGDDGLGGFTGTRALIIRAIDQKSAGHMDAAHALFVEAGQHIEVSGYFKDVGERAVHGVAMLETSEWSPALAEAA